MVRRLASILVTDVEGFSRLMEADEAGALEELSRRWSEILAPLAAAKGGRVVKYMGDGALVEFASVVDAVGVALDVQRAMAAAKARKAAKVASATPADDDDPVAKAIAAAKARKAARDAAGNAPQ